MEAKMMLLTTGERALISVLIKQMPGVDKNDARMVVTIGESLRFEEEFSVASWKEEQPFELSKLEIGWLKDKLNESFRGRKVPPSFAREALALSDKLEMET